jgi:hypothetical protein
MRCLNLLVASALVLGLAWTASTVADGAELSGEYQRAQPPRVQAREAAVATTPCGWRCRAPCPDGYSCYPLYGNARLPYGTPPYWSRYTASGWTP